MHYLKAIFQQHQMQTNFEKFSFVKKSLHYLGHGISSRGIHTDQGKIDAFQQMPSLTTLKELRSFLGLASWYQRFDADFTNLAVPLNKVIKKRHRWA